MSRDEATTALRTLRAAVDAGRIKTGQAMHTENRLIDIAVGASMTLTDYDRALLANAA